jgi:hypothetical protein
LTNIGFGAAMRRALSLAMLASLAGLTACGWLQDQLAEPAAVHVAVGENTNKQRQTLPGDAPTFDLQADCMPSHLEPDTRPDAKPGAVACFRPTMFRFTDDSGTSPDQAVMRNRFQDYLMWRSEQQCERHKARLVATQSTANFAFNTVTTSTAAVAAIVLAPASNILAALAAISSGTRSHMNEDFYRQYIGPAIVKRINVDRASKYTDIMSKRVVQATDSTAISVIATTKSVTTTVDTTTATRRLALLQDYTVEAAIADVERYNQLCSFISGLSSLVDPGEKFDDTAKGLQARIQMLRDMQTANEAQAKALLASSATNTLTASDRTDADAAAKRLRDTNADISRQIMILQHQLLTAPLTVDSKPTKG